MEAAFLVDIRLPIMMGFLVFAGFAPRALPRRAAVGLTTAFGAMLLLRVAFLTHVWFGQIQDVADMRQVIAHVPPGSRVLVTRVRSDDNQKYWNAMPSHRLLFLGIPAFMHLPGMLIIERRSIWPLLFTEAAKQPLGVRPAYRDVTGGEGLMAGYKVLADDEPAANVVQSMPYLAHWATKYDYVMILAAGGAGDLATFRPDRLDLIATTDIAALFKVKKAN
jgi:hypothetical protein